MVERVRSLDWNATLLGAMGRWPDRLRLAMEVLLAHPQPAFIGWGPQLACLYNDSFVALLADRHPAALAKPCAQLWKDQRPAMDAVLAGESHESEMGRFTLLWTPLRDDTGAVAGLMCLANEKSGSHPAERERARLDRERTEEALRESEGRLRLIVESARDYAIFTTDADNRIVDWWPGAEAVFGWSRDEAEGMDAAVLFTPEDRSAGEHRKEIDTARAEGKAADIRWHLRKSGERVFIEGQVIALRDNGAEPRGFLKIGRDSTERRTAEKALRNSEERFRQFGEASSDLLWIRDASSLDFEYLSPAFERLYGEPRDEVMGIGGHEKWLALLHQDDRQEAMECLRRLQAGQPLSHEFRVVRPHDGQVRWIRNNDFPLFDTKGRVQRIAGVAQDMTEVKQAMHLQETLLAELQHRVRNIMAMIRSIARRTAMNRSSVEDYSQHLEARIDAMARTQAALTRGAAIGVGLHQLILEELLAQAAADRQFSIDGPDVTLSARAAEVLTLAIHELATNSIKYGALTALDGHVHVGWTAEEQEGRRWLKLSWIESGVAPQRRRRNRQGFGFELITQRVPYELNGRGAIQFGGDGVVAEIAFPLEESGSILETRGPAAGLRLA